MVYPQLIPRIFTSLSPRIFTNLFSHLCHGLPRHAPWGSHGMATLRLQHLDAAARCADGSVPAYYLREGPSDVSLGKIGEKNWVNIKTWVECNELI